MKKQNTNHGYKTRNQIAKLLPQFKQLIIKNKKKYTRKFKHSKKKLTDATLL